MKQFYLVDLSKLLITFLTTNVGWFVGAFMLFDNAMFVSSEETFILIDAHTTKS